MIEPAQTTLEASETNETEETMAADSIKSIIVTFKRKDKRADKDERFAYLVASIHSLEGRADEAAEVLQKAIRSNEENRVHAFHDPDFAPLRDSETHREIFQLP